MGLNKRQIKAGIKRAEKTLPLLGFKRIGIFFILDLGKETSNYEVFVWLDGETWRIKFVNKNDKSDSVSVLNGQISFSARYYGIENIFSTIIGHYAHLISVDKNRAIYSYLKGNFESALTKVRTF
jgi:hypothetical protein